jgi:hypothetical protein
MPQSGTGNPAVNYLTPVADTIAGTASIFLPDSNETAVLTVSIPTPSGKPIVFNQPVLLNPQQVYYKVTVVVPGLLLMPNTSLLVAPDTISVLVTMMCGCKVTIGLPTSFWTYTDFAVSARIRYKDRSEAQVNLAFDHKTNASLFIAPVINFDNISEINYAAQQKSTGNYGALLQRF